MIIDKPEFNAHQVSNAIGDYSNTANFGSLRDDLIGASLELKFRGLEAERNHEREIRSRLLELLEFAPYRSHLTVQIRKAQRVYSLHAQLNSAAGRFFARAFDLNLMNGVSQLIEALQERIDEWRSNRELARRPKSLGSRRRNKRFKSPIEEGSSEHLGSAPRDQVII